VIVKLVKSHTEFLNLGKHWTELWESACPDNIFLHFGWIRSFVEAFGLENQLYIMTWQIGDDVRAILPLRRDSDGFLQVIGTPRSDYSDLICRKENIAAATDDILGYLGNRRDWRRLEIRELSERSFLYQHLHLNPELPCVVNWRASSKCPGIEFSGDGRVLEQLVGKKSLRRRENGLARKGQVEFRRLDRWVDIQSMLDRYYDMHIGRWKLAGVESQYADPAERRFCELYVKSFLDAGLLHFTVLFCGDTVMAMHIGFVTKNVFFWYKPSFNVQYKQLSPGEVLIKRLLEYCGEAEVGYFDFTRGVEQFKKRFSNKIYRNYDLIVFARKSDQVLYRLGSSADELWQRFMLRSQQIGRRLRTIAGISA